jgi:hypothetical protein
MPPELFTAAPEDVRASPYTINAATMRLCRTEYPVSWDRMAAFWKSRAGLGSFSTLLELSGLLLCLLLSRDARSCHPFRIQQPFELLPRENTHCHGHIPHCLPAFVGCSGELGRLVVADLRGEGGA